jgi:putative transposase
MIDANNGPLSVAAQCDLLFINRSSYYYKAKAISSKDLQIMKIIDETYTTHPYYGTRRMSKCLQAKGYDVGRKVLRRYYRIMGLEAIYPKKNLSKRSQAHKVYPYLLRDMEITEVNQVWSADITYVRLREGFVYLVAIIDWYSRYGLSWQVSINLDSEFCVSALEEALAKYGKPKIFNTDQGVQFTSERFIMVLTDNAIDISMDGKGRALDNVFIERFWRSLKQEKIYIIILNTVREAKNAISDYMSFYNTERMHQSLEYLTPEKVYFKKNIG